MQLCKTPEIENTILEGFTYHAKSFPYYYMSDYETAVKYNDIAYRILREGLDDIGHRRVLEFQVFNHYLLGEDSKGDHYHEIFKEMVQNKPKLGELDYLIHIDYHKAIKLMRSPRSRYRGKAEELFEKVLSALSTSKTGYFLSKLDVHRFLLEIQLKDLENSSDTELIRDIEFHIEEIRSLAASSGSLLWLTLIDIIKGRILQVKGEFKKAAKILSEIEEQISDSRFKLLQTMVREEKEMMATKFKEIQDIYQSNATIGERIKSMELSEYLTKALSFSEMENGD
jgi:tetratricopeptide (TPR) repeat protein